MSENVTTFFHTVSAGASMTISLSTRYSGAGRFAAASAIRISGRMATVMYAGAFGFADGRTRADRLAAAPPTTAPTNARGPAAACRSDHGQHDRQRSSHQQTEHALPRQRQQKSAEEQRRKER